MLIKPMMFHRFINIAQSLCRNNIYYIGSFKILFFMREEEKIFNCFELI